MIRIINIQRDFVVIDYLRRIVLDIILKSLEMSDHYISVPSIVIHDKDPALLLAHLDLPCRLIPKLIPHLTIRAAHDVYRDNSWRKVRLLFNKGRLRLVVLLIALRLAI